MRGLLLAVVPLLGVLECPAEEFRPVHGGRGRACRGASSDDESQAYYRIHADTGSIERCRSHCKAAVMCTGIEYHHESRVCKVWTRVIGTSTPAEGSTCQRYGGPMPVRHQRLFVNNQTGSKALRPGFRYPRHDARMHDGDEVQFKGHSWISIAAVPRGTVTLRGSRAHGFCGRRGPALVCSTGSAGRERITVQDVGESGRFSLQVGGKFCADELEGLRCDREQFPGPQGAFETVDMGNGKRSLKGGRAGQFCSDRAEGIVCKATHPLMWELFEFHSSSPPRLILTQSANPRLAAVFVVKRARVGSPEVALQCKEHGKYLAVDGRDGVVGCFSNTPKTFHYKRIDGQKWWTPDRGSLVHPGTSRYLQGEEVKWGGSVKAAGLRPDGLQLFSIHLLAGYETVSPIVRGVNLGNWFVLEKWMDHKLFLDADNEKFQGVCKAIDEYGVMKHLDNATKLQRMERHWSTWITETDIAWLAGHGINTVRVPFGYWLTHPEFPFITGQFKYMEKLFEWCERHSVAVLLDFHGLKGSQQGQATSGNCGACTHKRCGETWVRYLEYEETNLAVIANVSAHFSRSPVYLGFGVANELGGSESHQAMSFYQKAYDIIRKHNTDAFVFLYPTFRPTMYPFQREDNMVQDNHIYFRTMRGGAGFDHRRNLERASHMLLVSAWRWPVVVGEWSLGGHGTYTGKLSKEDLHDWYVNFGKAQLQAYEQHSMGWVYWSYKTIYPGSPWNYREMCERGRLPGCTAGYDFTTNDWWSNNPCAFTYLNHTHMGKNCPEKSILI